MVAVLVAAICTNVAQFAPVQRSMLYPATAMLSVDAVQVSPICVAVASTATRFAGVLGGVVSAPAPVVPYAEFEGGLTLPAASFATTMYPNVVESGNFWSRYDAFVDVAIPEKLVHPVPVHRLMKYSVTPTLSVAGVHVTCNVVGETDVTCTFVGLVGAVVSLGLAIVTTADPDLKGAACDTAVTITVAGFGTAAGAVYIPAAEIVPCVGSPPAAPFTCQVSPPLAAPVTVAENGCVWPKLTMADVGDITTVTGSCVEEALDAQP